MAWRDAHRWWATTLALTAVLVVPSLWDVSASAAQTSGDIALIELRVRDVLSAHPPLVGAYSRYGWDHPGPAFSWLAALPYRLLGGGAGALGLVAVASNTVGIMVLLRFAVRLGRAAWYVIAATLVALVLGLPPDALASVWNVTITNVALLLFVVACWGVWAGVGGGWIALVAGSFVVQSHVGTGVVIGPLAVATAGLVARRWWCRDRPLMELVAPATVVGLLWLLPTGIDALTDPPGNLARLVRWALTHDETQIGADTAVRLLGHTSSLTFVVQPRLERGVFLDIESVRLGVLPGLAVVLLVGAGLWSWGAGWRRETVWCAIVGSLWVSGFVAAASVTRPLGWWLVQWLEPLGWMTWSAIALVGWRLVAEHRPSLRTTPALPAVVLATLAVGAAVHAVDVVRSHERTTVQDDTIRRLADAAVSTEPVEPVAIATDPESLLADATLAGVVAALDRRGIESCVDDRLSDKFRDHRVCGTQVGDRLLLRLERIGAAAPLGSSTVVVVDPLTEAQRNEADRLMFELADILRRDGREEEIRILETPLADVVLLDEPSPQLAARADDVRRLAELRSVPGDRYGLYVYGRNVRSDG